MHKNDRPLILNKLFVVTEASPQCMNEFWLQEVRSSGCTSVGTRTVSRQLILCHS